jgi:hypothetical protein
VDETVKEGEPKVERNFEDRDAKKDADSEEYSARESNSDWIQLEGGTSS